LKIRPKLSREAGMCEVTTKSALSFLPGKLGAIADAPRGRSGNSVRIARRARIFPPPLDRREKL